VNGPLRVNGTFLKTQYLLAILVVGSFAISFSYLNSQTCTDETEDLATPPSDLKPSEPGQGTGEPSEEPKVVENEEAIETEEEPNEEPTGVPCDVRIEALHLSVEKVYAGEPMEVRVLLRNHGEDDAHYEIELRVSGELEATREVELEPDAAVGVVFTITRDYQGGFIVQAGDLSAMLYVIQAGLEISNLRITPDTVDLGDPVMLTVEVYNPNHVETTGSVDFRIGEEDYMSRNVTVGPLSTQTVAINTTMFESGWYHVYVGSHSETFEVTEEPYQEDESDSDPVRPEPTYYWVPDPLTENFTNILPPGASPVRLVLPAPIEDIFFEWQSGTGGYGLHAGGHIEGLDHVWIEIRAGIPVRSWGDGVVTQISYSGDVEHGEIHIYIDYGWNLIGSHMEIAIPLVEEGDNVSRGDPIGYGMSDFSGQQSAEFSLVDRGRTDGIWAGNGVAVSPYDYLEEKDKLVLVEAYKAHTVEKYGSDPRVTWLFDASQPYLTNPLLIHMVNEGRITGEWYLYSSPWAPGWPNDMLIFIEADNPWYTDKRVISNDDTNEDSQPRNIDGTFDVDYERGRVLIYNRKYGGILFGLFEIDESGERALLRIEFNEYRYPEEFTDEALEYIERTNLGRRWDAMELGLRDGP
jgi:hypothetical protein